MQEESQCLIRIETRLFLEFHVVPYFGVLTNIVCHHPSAIPNVFIQIQSDKSKEQGDVMYVVLGLLEDF